MEENNPLTPFRTQVAGAVGSVLEWYDFAIMLLYAAGFYVLFVWMPTYQSKIIPNPIDHAMEVNTMGMVALVLLVPVAGLLGDKVGFKRVVLLGIALTGIVAYNVAVGVFGGTAPMVCTWLIDQTGNIAAPAYYLLLLAIISFAALITLRVKQHD